MVSVQIIWDDEPEGNVEHLAEHGITPEEFEEVFFDPTAPVIVSKTSGRPMKFGDTSTGKHIAIVWDEVDDDPRIINPVTAYEAPPRGSST
jgi:uncharacterized DUF497 family protein